jgi:hypothetical protein
VVTADVFEVREAAETVDDPVEVDGREETTLWAPAADPAGVAAREATLIACPMPTNATMLNAAVSLRARPAAWCVRRRVTVPSPSRPRCSCRRSRWSW